MTGETTDYNLFMKEQQALRDFLAQNYSTHAEVKELWGRVGGNTGRILDQTDSRSRWTALIQQMDSGAVPRLKLLTAVLNDYPGSKVVLDQVATLIPLAVVSPVQQLVKQVSHARQIEPVDIDFTALDALKADEVVPAIAVQIFQSTPEEQQRFRLNLDTLKEKVTEATLGAVAPVLLTALLEGVRLVFGG